MDKAKEGYWIADLYGELQLAPAQPRFRIRAILPGIIPVTIAAFAALWLSGQYGAPPILIGLLLGFALNFASADARLLPGLDFASQSVLRIGIVLLGLRITFAEVATLGLSPFLALLTIMAAVIATGILFARLARLDWHFGLLAGGATAICGISAALALWGMIGAKRVSQESFAIVVLGITLASALALLTYPGIGSLAGLSDSQAGFLMGASIHDVAQAIGGGFAFSERAGDVATLVKLSRVALLVPLLLLAGLVLGRASSGAEPRAGQTLSLTKRIPWFILAFAAVCAVNSLVDLPPALSAWGLEMASFCLLLAITAAAMKADLSAILTAGWRSFVPVIGSSLVAFLLALAAARLVVPA
ncbi:putative sulfate exporter family transporter [Qipengyuania sp. XHP0207]|uniref:YeiH family protein n=1 Tax=Qipengyuania sp. XHP0207 TaxID=3038078 RepID=UPI0024204067|nr:putative sulfate exporter family transporter [Qipengyuania sp. XHP0207]MDG5749271.1 putative sulfate exporter family transporter [Qipengyuania sp. XHP0207]